MQDRYTGDIGDYYKYGLMRKLAPGHKMGLAWYLHPDENHNDAGMHVKYQDKPETWKSFDPDVFETLKSVIERSDQLSDYRNIRTIEKSGLLGDCVFAGEMLDGGGVPLPERADWRKAWFKRTLDRLKYCDLVVADPDNGLCEDGKYSPGQQSYWKRMPLSETNDLANGRTAVLYHHNSRFPGGHEKEIEFWLQRLPKGTMALRCRAYSARTYFVVNPTPVIRQRVEDFAAEWRQAELYPTD